MLHGGAVAMIFDNLSSIALSLWGIMMAPDDSELQRTWAMSGVSRTLNCSYVRPAPVGSEIDVTNEVVGAGKTMGM
jgi:acyl-coenzyme A thioesterase 13